MLRGRLIPDTETPLDDGAPYPSPRRILLSFGMDRTLMRQQRRRSAFQRIRSQYKTAAAMSEALGDGFSPSYVSQLLSGTRGIGDEVATKIEDRLGLSPGYLDHETAPNLPPADQQFLATVTEGIATHELPEHVRQAILTLISSSPEKH